MWKREVNKRDMLEEGESERTSVELFYWKCYKILTNFVVLAKWWYILVLIFPHFHRIGLVVP